MGFLRGLAKVVLIGQGKRIAKMIIQEQVRRLSPGTIQAIEQGLSAAYFMCLQTPSTKDDIILRNVMDFLGINLVTLGE